MFSRIFHFAKHQKIFLLKFDLNLSSLFKQLCLSYLIGDAFWVSYQASKLVQLNILLLFNQQYLYTSIDRYCVISLDLTQRISIYNNRTFYKNIMFCTCHYLKIKYPLLVIYNCQQTFILLSIYNWKKISILTIGKHIKDIPLGYCLLNYRLASIQGKHLYSHSIEKNDKYE